MSYLPTLRKRFSLLAPPLLLGALSACSFRASVSASGSTKSAADPNKPINARPAAKPAKAEKKPKAPPKANKPSKPQKASKAKVTIKGSQVILRSSVAFDEDSAKLSTTGNEFLAELVKYLAQNARVTQLRIEGHTHNQRPEPASLALSGQRASALKIWLVKQGVDKARLLAVGFGQQQPLESNAETDGRAKNERTSFHIAGVDGKPYLGADPSAGGTAFP